MKTKAIEFSLPQIELLKSFDDKGVLRMPSEAYILSENGVIIGEINLHHLTYGQVLYLQDTGEGLL